MDEWKEIMSKHVKELPWDNHLKDILNKEINESYDRVVRDAYLMNPSLYVLKCKK